MVKAIHGQTEACDYPKELFSELQVPRNGVKSVWTPTALVLEQSQEKRIHGSAPPLLFFFFKFLAALGLRCRTRAFSSCGEQELLFAAVHGLLIAVASLVVEHRL